MNTWECPRCSVVIEFLGKDYSKIQQHVSSHSSEAELEARKQEFDLKYFGKTLS